MANYNYYYYPLPLVLQRHFKALTVDDDEPTATPSLFNVWEWFWRLRDWKGRGGRKLGAIIR